MGIRSTGFWGMQVSYPALARRAPVALRKYRSPPFDLSKAVVGAIECHHPPRVRLVVATALQPEDHAQLGVNVEPSVAPTTDGAPNFDVSVERKRRRTL